jgi:hypothetical protein
MDTLSDPGLEFAAFWVRLLAVVSAVAMLLSMAGIYAVMSFTVARRTREIGIRVALGASRRRVVAAVFARPLAQVGLGVVAGGVLTVLLGDVESDPARPRGGAGVRGAHARRVPARRHRADAARAPGPADRGAAGGRLSGSSAKSCGWAPGRV